RLAGVRGERSGGSLVDVERARISASAASVIEPDAPQKHEARPFLGLLKEHEDELRNILSVIRRRKSLILGTVVLVTLVAAIVALQIAPRYTATATLMLNTRNQNVVNIASVLAGLPLDPNIIKSEVDVLQSRALAGRVIRTLHLMDDREIN